ncbi:MAG: FtsH protease activity modulator HflK [Gammaproteobacteria bacterium]|nr:FtsH protease activity modulator HflK [Gammaproteobacteria bacterium]
MAWNDPGNRGESPWSKKRPAPKSGGENNPFGEWLDKLKGSLGGPGAGGDSGNVGGGGESAGSPAAFGLMLAGVLVLLWLASGMFQINASEKGVVQRFGRFTEVRNEGWGWAFPWPIETVTKVNVTQVNSVEYKSRVLTADVNLVEIRLAIQYLNADPVKVLFQVRDVEATLREVSESAIREVVGQASLDDVLGSARLRITDSTKERIQRTLDTYNSGMSIANVNLTDVQVPEAVVAAQRDANKAIEDRERYQKEALAYTNDVVPKAEGAAQRLGQDAEAYKAQVVALAEGDVARFNSIYAAYTQAPDVTRQRMYIETIEQIMQQSKKVILDTKQGGNGNMIYLPLDKLLERQSARPAAVPAPAAPVEELPTVTIDGRSRGVR